MGFAHLHSIDFSHPRENQAAVTKASPDSSTQPKHAGKKDCGTAFKIEGPASPKSLLSGRPRPALADPYNQKDAGLTYPCTSCQAFNYIFPK